MVMIMGLTLMGLGVSRVVRNQAQHASYAKEAGFPALQALYGAEMGINLTLWQNNSPTVRATPLTTAANPTYSLKMTYPPALTVEREVNVNVTYVGQPVAGDYQFRSIGTVRPKAGATNFQPVSHRLLFTIRQSGGYWVLVSYADD